MLYGIVIFPSKPVQDFANSLRKRYDPHYNAIQPHITVRESEDWNEDQLSKATAYLEQISQQIAPFDIVFNRVSTFYPVNHVIYLALQNTEAVTRLHQALNNGPLANHRPHYVFTPHLTLGQQLSADELHDVYSSLKHQSIQFADTVDRIHILYQTENKSWTAYQSFLFRGKR